MLFNPNTCMERDTLENITNIFFFLQFTFKTSAQNGLKLLPTFGNKIHSVTR